MTSLFIFDVNIGLLKTNVLFLAISAILVSASFHKIRVNIPFFMKSLSIILFFIFIMRGTPYFESVVANSVLLLVPVFFVPLSARGNNYITIFAVALFTIEVVSGGVLGGRSAVLETRSFGINLTSFSLFAFVLYLSHGAMEFTWLMKLYYLGISVLTASKQALLSSLFLIKRSRYLLILISLSPLLFLFFNLEGLLVTKRLLKLLQLTESARFLQHEHALNILSQNLVYFTFGAPFELFDNGYLAKPYFESTALALIYTGGIVGVVTYIALTCWYCGLKNNIKLHALISIFFVSNELFTTSSFFALLYLYRRPKYAKIGKSV